MFTTVKRTCWTSRSMLRPRPRWVPLALAMVMATAVGGCGAGAQPPEAPAAAQESAPVDDNAVLAKRIGELPDLGSVYGALPPSVTTTLEKQIAALNDADRATLLDPEGVIARLRPLLYVVGGGGSPLALRALAFSPAAARELAEQAPGTLPVGASSWGPVVNQVSRRAARQLLARERLDYDREGEWSASQIDRVRRCAALLGQWELVDSAMALQLKNEPSMAHRLQAARRALQAVRIDEARWLLDLVDPEKPSQKVELARLRALQLSAESVQEVPAEPPEVSLAVAQARSHMRLQAFDSAEAWLKGIAPEAALRLDVAVLQARVASRDDLCPGIPSGTGTRALCAALWKAHWTRLGRGRSLELAWQSGQGRDALSAESYFGLRYVVPWMYGGASGQSLIEELAQLSQAASEVESLAPRFSGLRLSVDTLRSVLLASMQRESSQAIQVPQDQQDELVSRAIQELKKSPTPVASTAAALSVAAMLVQHRDLSSLLNSLPENMPPALARVGAELQLLSAIATDNQAMASKAKERLTEILLSPGTGEDRAEMVLALSEASFAMSRKPGDAEVLARVAERLLSSSNPPQLRLRAVLDRAGALQAIGDTTGAIESLEKIIADQTPPGPRDPRWDLYVLARSYLLILRGTSAGPAERREYRELLARYLDEVDAAGGAAPSVRAWTTAWSAQLRGSFRLNQRALGNMVGKQNARLMRAGTLPAGSINLSFRYTADGKLTNVVGVGSRLLPLRLP